MRKLTVTIIDIRDEAGHRIILETRTHSPSIEKYIRVTTVEIRNQAGKVEDNMNDVIIKNRTRSAEIYQIIQSWPQDDVRN